MGPAGCSALPAALPMVVPTQPARRLQPRRSSFPKGSWTRLPEPGAKDSSGWRGWARLLSAQRRAGAGVRRPIAAAPSEGAGGKRGSGRKSGCRRPGPEGWAGGRKLRRGLPPRRFSNFCCRSRCAQTAVLRRAPGPRGAGCREGAGAGAGRGSSAAMARRPGATGSCTCGGGGGRRCTCPKPSRPRRGREYSGVLARRLRVLEPQLSARLGPGRGGLWAWAWRRQIPKRKIVQPMHARLGDLRWRCGGGA